MRDLLAAHSVSDVPAARTLPAGKEAGEVTVAPTWLPGEDFERHVPRREVAAGGWRDRLRWDPGRRGAAALGVLLVVAVAATGWWLAAARPHEVPISGSGLPSRSATITSSAVSAASSSMAPQPPSASAGSLVVDVAGKVRHPGIYELESGSRVYDAVRAAGGARPGVSTLSLNLAEPLRDGEQVVVGGVGSGGAASASGAAGTSAGVPPAVVALNTANLDQLETLPGVGPVLGQHILDWRDAHGRFTSIDQLREVSGIGDVRFAQLRPLVSL